MKSLIHPSDKYAMNWIEGTKEWGTVICPPTLTCEVTSKEEGEKISETYKFTNTSSKTVFVSRGEISIYTTFNDNYDLADVCLKQRCHAHIWCGGDVSYIMGIRMGGEPPHLGLALTKGSLDHYSVERNLRMGRNDRGDILLHPSPFTLEPGESYQIEWLLFWHGGEEDFYKKLKKLSKFIEVKTERYVYELGQKVNIMLFPSFSYAAESVCVTRNGEVITPTISNRMIDISEWPEEAGVYEYSIQVRDVKTICRIFVQIPLEKLLRKRCRFITENQQYHNRRSRLNGAYLIYDNEEHKMHYDSDNDHNAGRERIGMGVLLASYLQTYHDNDMMNSLLLYIDFVYRELYDEKTGEVFNDAGRDNAEHRLYNYPWMARFFIELYMLLEEKKYVEDAYKIMKYYYEHGGMDYYAGDSPIVDLLYYMEVVGMEKEIRILMKDHYDHARIIVRNGTNYPPHEVKFEQRIVASAAKQLMRLYVVQGEKRFLAAAEEHVKILSLFNGHQPDYRLYECAIRHWDGKWFGKRGGYGDTFPHYWSALTGDIYEDYANITGKKELWKKAEACFYGALSLFRPNGSAHCAYMFPYQVNGKQCRGMDPWANAQDWALYYAWKFKQRKSNESGDNVW